MVSPSIELTLTPEVVDDAAIGIRVRYVLHDLGLEENDTLCRLPKVLFGVDAAVVADDGIRATDDDGELPLTHGLDEPTPSFTFRRWRTRRASVGDIHVEYVAPVRVVTAATTNGPLFDLRAEGSGVSGAGVAFLALPDREETFTAEIGWDLSQLPKGARGVSSHGENTVRRTATTEALTFTFYMAGMLGSYPESPDPAFGMFWLSDTKFDATEVGRHSHLLYQQMCEFFQEPDPGFRVFVRKHPFRGNGGSALPGSRGFMFGWSDEETQSSEDLKRLLSHETVHNWPLLPGDPEAVSWFNEGTAEYYSLLLPHRFGLIDDDTLVELFNERAHGYYGNPLQTLSNAEAAELYWKDWRAQRIPYGRGLFYLLDTDHKIGQASGGRRGVDDLVLGLLDRLRRGQEVTVQDWVDMVVAELGEAGSRDYEAMTAGARILPATDCLAPRFVAREVDIRQLNVGFDYTSLRTRTVTGVVAGGPADRAGVRDGDEIVDSPPPHGLPQRPVSEISLTLKRGEEMLRVHYEPLGELAPGRLWDKSN
ncbi:hypothetical protein ACQEV4_31375 [Streptomyces shenzhenensis]|uniref:hypothetical protein n=1 Tax=Streptomyces shenzhenensis TaxID=943815 RepID=UPI003D904822